MPSRRPSARAVLAATTVAGLVAAALPADARPTAAPAVGAAQSTLAVLRVTLGGTTVTAGELAAEAADATPHVARLVVTPLDSSATGPLGRQTVTPADGAQTVPTAAKSLSFPGGLGSLTGPTFVAKAVDGARRQLAVARLQALGKVTLATLPLDLGVAKLADTAQVTAGAATATKTLTLGRLALPSVADLLSALGVDLDALVTQLTQGRLTELAGLVGGDVASLDAAVDTAQSTVTGLGGQAGNTLAEATSESDAATQQLSDANDAFDAKWGELFGALDGATQATLSGLGIDAGLTADDFNALGTAGQTALQTALGADYATLAGLAQAVADAEDLLSAVNDLVDRLQELVDALLAAVRADDDPLAALGDVSVATKAVASRSPQAAADVSVGSIDVLGQATDLAHLGTALGTVTGTLSQVLDSVTGVSFTPPSIELGAPHHAIRRDGRTRYAVASVSALAVTLPKLALPAALQLPGAPDVTGGRLAVGVLAESAQWTPATAPAPATGGGSPPPSSGSTPTTSGSPLPDTGGRALLPVVGLLVVGAGLALRRRLRSAA